MICKYFLPFYELFHFVDGVNSGIFEGLEKLS